MEYLGGGTLEFFVYCARKFTKPEYSKEKESFWANISYQALKSIRCLHAIRLSHRDIKGENFVFNNDYKLKLIDLGFTVDSTGTKSKGSGLMKTKLGTPLFMAPEINDDKNVPYFGNEVDMFAFGILIFYLVTKDVPFYNISKTSKP